MKPTAYNTDSLAMELISVSGHDARSLALAYEGFRAAQAQNHQEHSYLFAVQLDTIQRKTGVYLVDHMSTIIFSLEQQRAKAA